MLASDVEADKFINIRSHDTFILYTLWIVICKSFDWTNRTIHIFLFVSILTTALFLNIGTVVAGPYG